jgi:nicotinate phosphoribosyltransferase
VETVKWLHIASEEEVKKGETTDIYFVHTKKVLEAKGLNKVKVVAEITPTGLPQGWPWAVYCGLEEALRLLEGYPVDVYSLPEGSIFHPTDSFGVRAPVMVVEGPYGAFGLLETPLLGLLCQATGIATKAARMRKLAPKSLLISFGIRRIHPVISPMVDRAAYIGGFDSVSSLSGAKLIGRKPTGTMPHALIILFGDQAKAWKAFDEVVEAGVPRIALVDTYSDEKTEAIKAAEALGEKLYGVRLDTPKSRRGNLPQIVREVRWELSLRGFSHVKILVSGGIDEKDLPPLIDAGVEGFGIGSSISAAPIVDFALDIVEKEGKPVAKKGKLGGSKKLWRCPRCLTDTVLPAQASQPPCPACGGKTESMLKPVLKNGKLTQPLPASEEIRKYLLQQLEKLRE